MIEKQNKDLIKENHLAAAGGISTAVQRGRDDSGELKVEVEVTTLDELGEALGSRPDWILLDNFDPQGVGQAMKRIETWAGDHPESRPTIEVSGGITERTAGDYAVPGVDFLSSGALTHSVRALDLSLNFQLDTSSGSGSTEDN